MSDGRFEGRGILVTGGASGIGLETARALAREGARLALADADEAKLASARQELGGDITALVVDVRQADQVATMVDRAFESGSLDGLVNCAGIYPVTRILDTSVEEWDRVIETNLRGPFLVSQAFARRLVAAGSGGQIVNVSSTAGVQARPGIGHYAASKAGLNLFTRVLAIELAPNGIRVNAILPGVIGTERVLDWADTPQGRRETDTKLAKIPMRRLGRPEELVPMILFLLSEESSYATGGLFTVDGGYTLGLAE